VADVAVVAIIVILDDCVHLCTVFLKPWFWFRDVRVLKWDLLSLI